MLDKLRTTSRLSVSERFGGSAVVRRLLCLTLLLGGWPLACLSDVQLPACVERDDCAGSGGGALGKGDAGTPDESAGALGTDPAGTGGAAVNAGGALPGAGSSPVATGGSVAGTGTGGSPGAGGDGGDGGGGGEGGVPVPCEACSMYPDALPAACGTDAYSTILHVVGGSAPYQASASAATGVWNLDADPAHPNDGAWFRLSGNAAGATSLTLRFVDAAERVFTKVYPVQPRTACWFAYVRSNARQPELVVVDPILQKVPPITLVNNHGVYDFRFSRNGRFLAYRYGQDPAQPSRAHLALLDLSTWQERALAFDSEDAVTAFAWSDDSSVLAVAYDRLDSPSATSRTTYLGGVRFTPGTGGALLPVTLTPVQAYVQSDLYWGGTDSVAFHAALLPIPSQPGQFRPNPLRLRTPYFAKLGTVGFDTPQPVVTSVYDADTPLVVQPTPSGFYLISAHDPYANFYPIPATGSSADHWTDVVSPSGALSALVDDSQLQLFLASKGSDYAPLVTSAPDFDCPQLLTWAKGRERLACVANVDGAPADTTHGEVRIFDFDGSSLTGGVVHGFCPQSTDGTNVTECGDLEYSYGEQRSQQQARAFSSSGNWLAFSTSAFDSSLDNYLYVADLRSSTFVTKRKDYSDVAPPTSNIALAFAPNEHYLIQQRDTALTVHDVPVSGNGNTPQHLQIPAKHTPTACSEDFSGARDRWCGDAQTAALLAWASDSRSFAYRTQQGLTVVDIDDFPTTDSRTFIGDECQDECSNQFDFQPLP